MGSERLFAALVVSVALFVSPAGAEPTAADRETARALMKEGDRYSNEGDAAQALRAYQAAHGIMNVPPTGMAVVRAFTQLGRLVEARDVALQVIRSSVQHGESPVFAKARQEAAAAARDLEARIAGLVVRVEGARVVIDGAVLADGAVGLVRKLDPGKHVVVVSAPGHEEVRLEVTLAEGETRELSPTLVRIPEPDAPSKPPPARTAKAQVEPAPPAAERQPTSSGRWLMIGGASAAVAGVAVGSITGIMAIQRSSDLRSSCPSSGCPPSRQDDYDSAARLATVSNVAFAVGAVGIGVGVSGYFLSSSEPAARGSRSSVWPVAGLGALGLEGRF
ncbi:MAG: PEGA domain-containing protein [Sorangiineae bacterium PRO1]|nr:PEGA domain-containing protein [Sorangiineae bacterium PRO1]